MIWYTYTFGASDAAPVNMPPSPCATAERLACAPNSQPWLMKLASALCVVKTKITWFLLTPKPSPPCTWVIRM